jgi:hypothetical protein
LEKSSLYSIGEASGGVASTSTFEIPQPKENSSKKIIAPQIFLFSGSIHKTPELALQLTITVQNHNDMRTMLQEPRQVYFVFEYGIATFLDLWRIIILKAQLKIWRKQWLMI